MGTSCITQNQMFASVQRRHKELPSSHRATGTSGLWQRSLISLGQHRFPSAIPRRRWRRRVQHLVTELFPFFLSFSQSADKRAVWCQANSPQPTGYRRDDREQIKQKDECSLRGSGSISDSSDPRQFLSSLTLPFFFCYSAWH